MEKLHLHRIKHRRVGDEHLNKTAGRMGIGSPNRLVLDSGVVVRLDDPEDRILFEREIGQSMADGVEKR